MFGIWIALGTVALLAAACNSAGGGDGGAKGRKEIRDDLRPPEAFATLQQMIRETARVAAPDLRVNVAEDAEVGWTGCEDGDAAHVFNTWGVDVLLRPDQEPADLLPAVEAHWKAKGFDLDRRRMDDRDPDLFALTGGFVLRAAAVPGSPFLAITGDTPCVPKGEEADPTRGPDDLTFEQAVARLTPLVEATAKAATTGPGDFKSRLVLGECADPGDTSVSVVVDLPLAAGREPADLLPAIEDYWTGQGYDIDRQTKPDGRRDLYANLGDNDLRAVAIPGSGQLNVTGRAPCVPKPADAPAGNRAGG